MNVTHAHLALARLLARQAVRELVSGKSPQPCGNEPRRSNHPVQNETPHK